MRTLTITDTNVLKGIALLLLLCHHCFYPGEPYDDIIVVGVPIIRSLAIFSKLCVAIFVFLSGYGLTIQTMKKGGIGNVFSFYCRRYVKLMINYWLIWLIFVPMGVLFFHRTFSFIYGEHYIFRAFWDFLGLHQAVFNEAGYNATWWFYSCIIVLYLLFPIIWRYHRFWFILIPSAICIPVVTDFVPFFKASGYGPYFVSFVCGMSYAYLDPRQEIRGGGKFLLLVILVIACFYRHFFPYNRCWDAAIVTMIVTLYSSVSFPRILSKLLVLLGKHSYNIFLFHTFIFSYYFKEYIYFSSNPLLIYLFLLAVCILISMLIEWIRASLHINKLQDKVIKKLDS